MLNEMENTKQHWGEPYRKWFNDHFFDLIVWYSSDEVIYGFQLCYKLGWVEKALTWRNDRGFSHNTVDYGGLRPGGERTPILVADGVFDKNHILTLFERESQEIDPSLIQFVSEKLKDYPIDEDFENGYEI